MYTVQCMYIDIPTKNDRLIVKLFHSTSFASLVDTALQSYTWLLVSYARVRGEFHRPETRHNGFIGAEIQMKFKKCQHITYRS